MNVDDCPGVSENCFVTERLVAATVTRKQEASGGAWVSESSTVPRSSGSFVERVQFTRPMASVATPVIR